MVRWLQIGQIRGNVEAFLQDQRGSVFAIMGFGLVMAAGFTALAVDMSYLYVLKGRLQTTADFAALAAVVQLPDEDAARAIAIEYTEKNMPAVDHGTVLTETDFVAGNWDANTRQFVPAGTPLNAVRLVARRSSVNNNPAPVFFAQVFGFNDVDIDASATVAFTPQRLELAMVLDNSGSMDMFGGSMQYLIDASDQLLDMVFDGSPTLTESRISIIPFRALVKPGTGHADWLSGSPPAGWNGCFLARFEPEAGDPYQLTDTPPDELPFTPAPDTSTSNRNCSVEIAAVEDSRATLDAAMNALGAQYQTDMHEAMAWAWRTLSPRWKGLWGDPQWPKDYDSDWRKVVIIATDGWSSPWMSPYNETEHDQKLPDICNDMKAQGIEIYVLWTNGGNNAKVAAEPYYEDCSSSGPFHFVDAQSAEDVQDAFREIAFSLIKPRLTQ